MRGCLGGMFSRTRYFAEVDPVFDRAARWRHRVAADDNHHDCHTLGASAKRRSSRECAGFGLGLREQGRCLDRCHRPSRRYPLRYPLSQRPGNRPGMQYSVSSGNLHFRATWGCQSEPPHLLAYPGKRA